MHLCTMFLNRVQSASTLGPSLLYSESNLSNSSSSKSKILSSGAALKSRYFRITGVEGVHSMLLCNNTSSWSEIPGWISMVLLYPRMASETKIRSRIELVPGVSRVGVLTSCVNLNAKTVSSSNSECRQWESVLRRSQSIFGRLKSPHRITCV